ncbi:MAG: hypothetical protein ACLFVJ_12915 [Persicimonas sp.]
MRHLPAIARTLVFALAFVAFWSSRGTAQVPRVEPHPEISPNYPGSCKTTVDSDSDGTPDEVTVHKYEDKRLVKSLLYSDPKKKPFAVITYEYDNKGRMTERTKLNGARDQGAGAEESGADKKAFGRFGSSREPVLFERVRFSYNNAGKLDRIVRSARPTESYEYNDEGELTAKVILSRSSCEPLGPDEHKETFVRSDGKIRSRISKCDLTTYKYDSSGRLTKRHERSTSRRGEPDTITAYEYDKQGNLLKEVRKRVAKAPWKGDSEMKQRVSTSTYDFSCWEEEGESGATK